MKEFVKVTVEEFSRHVESYGRPLKRSLWTVPEPPVQQWEDLARAELWPDTVVAQIWGDEYSIRFEPMVFSVDAAT